MNINLTTSFNKVQYIFVVELSYCMLIDYVDKIGIEIIYAM